MGDREVDDKSDCQEVAVDDLHGMTTEELIRELSGIEDALREQRSRPAGAPLDLKLAIREDRIVQELARRRASRSQAQPPGNGGATS